jgi:hypothetical protein
VRIARLLDDFVAMAIKAAAENNKRVIPAAGSLTISHSFIKQFSLTAESRRVDRLGANIVGRQRAAGVLHHISWSHRK